MFESFSEYQLHENCISVVEPGQKCSFIAYNLMK